MGIHYYAYPLPAEFVERARTDPRLFLSADPLADAWRPAEDRPTMLYLDKCWHYLQALTRPDHGAAPRPAYRLFEGEVSYVEDGAYRPWVRVLDAEEVAEIARDLALLDEDDVRTWTAATSLSRGREDFDYIKHYLAAAKDFITRLVPAGWGLLYLIG
jgi:hypothetical protein